MQRIQRDKFDRVYRNFPLHPPWEDGQLQSCISTILNKLRISPPNVVLDLGCGNGRNLNSLSSQGFDVYGIEFSYRAIKVAKERYDKSNAIVGNVIVLPFKNAIFDLILDIGLLHCTTPELRNIVKEELYRVIKENGYYLIFEFIRGEGSLYNKPIFYSYVNKKGKTRKKIPMQLQIPTWGFTLNDIRILFNPDFIIKECFYYLDRIVILMKKSSVRSKNKNVSQRYKIF